MCSLALSRSLSKTNKSLKKKSLAETELARLF